MVEDRKEWNREVIYELFPREVAEQILSIPLFLSNQEDTMTWKWTMNRKYSVRSGYRLIMEKEAELVGSSSSMTFPWSKVWSASYIPRCKDFVWRACHDILPVCTALQRKKIQPVQPQVQNVQQRLTKWEGPEINAYKANVDAAVSSNMGADIGVIFRNHKGEVMATTTSILPHTRDPLLAEALAINWAMKTAHPTTLYKDGV
ncbi:Reverse transcriptase zinc-binding domain [Sesbania bispinosa]|nr:Reverse transcriptase zinc-binding domain [Sesbania bispinosa]